MMLDMSERVTGTESEPLVDEIEVTPEMVEAGYDALWDEYDLLQEDVRPEQLKEALKVMFRAMWLARRTASPAS